MNTPVIPRKDESFDQLSHLVVNVSTQKAGPWGISPDTVLALAASHATWHAAYARTLNPASCTKGAVTAKNTARNAHEKLLRNFLKRWIMTNPAVTDADRTEMELPLYKKTRERVPPPHDVPNVTGMATIFDGRVALNWRGSESGSKANPYGQKAVIRYTVLPPDAPAPAHTGQLTHSLLTGRQPFKLSHPEEDWGKLLYFALAYQNRRGEMGAWSPIRSVIIPGMKIHYKPEPVTDARYETEKNPN